jgi:hypothetical protein
MSWTAWWTWSWYQTIVVILLFVIFLQLEAVGRSIVRAIAAIANVAHQITTVWDRVDRIADDREIKDHLAVALDDVIQRLAEILYQLEQTSHIHRDSLESIRDIQKNFNNTIYDIHSDLRYPETIHNSLTDIHDSVKKPDIDDYDDQWPTSSLTKE